MKLDEDTCQLIIFGANKERFNMHVGEAQIEESDDGKLPDITLDKKLSFKRHVQTLCKKANEKLLPRTRTSIYVEPEKLKLLIKIFVIFQFSYCLLIWMFHDRNLSNRINKIHERALRITYKDIVQR